MQEKSNTLLSLDENEIAQINPDELIVETKLYGFEDDVAGYIDYRDYVKAIEETIIHDIAHINPDWNPKLDNVWMNYEKNMKRYDDFHKQYGHEPDQKFETKNIFKKQHNLQAAKNIGAGLANLNDMYEIGADIMNQAHVLKIRRDELRNIGANVNLTEEEIHEYRVLDECLFICDGIMKRLNIAIRNTHNMIEDLKEKHLDESYDLKKECDLDFKERLIRYNNEFLYYDSKLANDSNIKDVFYVNLLVNRFKIFIEESKAQCLISKEYADGLIGEYESLNNTYKKIYQHYKINRECGTFLSQKNISSQKKVLLDKTSAKKLKNGQYRVRKMKMQLGEHSLSSKQERLISNGIKIHSKIEAKLGALTITRTQTDYDGEFKSVEKNSNLTIGSAEANIHGSLEANELNMSSDMSIVKAEKQRIKKDKLSEKIEVNGAKIEVGKISAQIESDMKKPEMEARIGAAVISVGLLNAKQTRGHEDKIRVIGRAIGVYAEASFDKFGPILDLNAPKGELEYEIEHDGAMVSKGNFFIGLQGASFGYGQEMREKYFMMFKTKEAMEAHQKAEEKYQAEKALGMDEKITEHDR